MMKIAIVAFIVIFTMNLCESKSIHTSEQIDNEISDPGVNTAPGSRLRIRSKRHTDGFFNHVRSASQETRSVKRLWNLLTPRMRRSLSRYPKIVRDCVAQKMASRRQVTKRNLRITTSMCLRRIVRFSS